jgi:hypothetical protein
MFFLMIKFFVKRRPASIDPLTNDQGDSIDIYFKENSAAAKKAQQQPQVNINNNNNKPVQSTPQKSESRPRKATDDMLKVDKLPLKASYHDLESGESSVHEIANTNINSELNDDCSSQRSGYNAMCSEIDESQISDQLSTAANNSFMHEEGDNDENKSLGAASSSVSTTRLSNEIDLSEASFNVSNQNIPSSFNCDAQSSEVAVKMGFSSSLNVDEKV